MTDITWRDAYDDAEGLAEALDEVEQRLIKAGRYSDATDVHWAAHVLREQADAPAPESALLDALRPVVQMAALGQGDMIPRDKAELLLGQLDRALSGQPASEQEGRTDTCIMRFTAYRRDMDSRDTHSDQQKNPESEPQYEGVIFTDGTVALRWLTPLRSTSIWPDLRTALGVHGHPEYGTEIEWHDGHEPAAWQEQCAALTPERTDNEGNGRGEA